MKSVPIRYSEVQEHFLRVLHRHPRKLITKWFNLIFETDVAVKSINSKLNHMGFYSPNNGRFPKGLVPWNKGTKGVMPKPINGFEKGHLPANALPVGSTRLGKDGEILVKVKGRRRWMPRARVVWQQHFGEIPKGYVIWHKNGVITDDRIENLELISRGELVMLNKYRHSERPDELKKSVELYARLKYHTGKMRKKHNDHHTQ